MKTKQTHEILNKYEQRLITEGKLKAFLLALTLGFAAVFLIGAVSWYTGTNALLLCLGIVLGAALIGTPIFYITIFRSSIQSKAKRIDRLGLDERAITMVELENDDSIFARLQREDTRKQLEKMDVKQLEYKFPRALLVWSAAVTVLGIAATVMCTLAAMGYMKTGEQIMDPYLPKPPVQYVYLEYIAEEGGHIEGNSFQEIILGENGTEVFAVADEGWIFVGWDDGYSLPDRAEFSAQSNLVMVAVFEPSGEEKLTETDEGDGDPDDRPAYGENEGQAGTGDSDQSGGGKYQMANQVIDGETYYREVIEQYADMINEYLSSGEEIPERIRKMIETYLEIIG